jgi:predicted acyltransferase
MTDESEAESSLGALTGAGLTQRAEFGLAENVLGEHLYSSCEVPPMSEIPETLSPKPQRLMSLDALRGMTIAGMLLVNNPGTWSSDRIYWPLQHAAWNGWTFTDLIFPFFLFMVGVAMMFSFPKRMARGESRGHLFGHVVRRAVVLFLLGMFTLPFIPSTAQGFFPALDSLGLWGNVARWATVWAFLCAIVLITGTKRPRFWFVGYLIGAALILLSCACTDITDPMKTLGWRAITMRGGVELIVIGTLVMIAFPRAALAGVAFAAVGVITMLSTLLDTGLAVQIGGFVAVLAALALVFRRRDPIARFLATATAAVSVIVAMSFVASDDPLWRWLTDRRLTGVLPRIGFCYLIASAIYFATPSPRAIVKWIIALLAIYWVWMLCIPIPGFGAADLSMGFPTLETPRDQLFSNWCFFIDYHVLGEHVWGARTLWLTETVGGQETRELIWSFDPEGILSTMSAVCSVLFGILTGLWLQRRDTAPVEKTNGMFFWGCTLCVIGLVMSIWFPINKRIWTSSYTVFMAGMALLCLGTCYHLIDVKGFRRWAMPFVWFGMNAITAFFFSGQMAVMLGRLKVSVLDESGGITFISWKGWIFDSLCGIAEPINASLIFAVGFVLFWTAIMWILYRQKIFLKI